MQAGRGFGKRGKKRSKKDLVERNAVLSLPPVQQTDSSLKGKCEEKCAVDVKKKKKKFLV